MKTTNLKRNTLFYLTDLPGSTLVETETRNVVEKEKIGEGISRGLEVGR
jgi:hypothetical protein